VPNLRWRNRHVALDVPSAVTVILGQFLYRLGLLSCSMWAFCHSLPSWVYSSLMCWNPSSGGSAGT